MKGTKTSSYELLLVEDASKICQWCWSVRSGDCEAKGGLVAVAGGCARPLPRSSGTPARGCQQAGSGGLSPAVCATRGDSATESTVFIANIPGDAGTRLVNYSNYLYLPSGAQRFNLGMALNQVSDIDQRILL